MNQTPRQALMVMFAQLGTLQPELRFGQLIELAGKLAGVRRPGELWQVEDDALLQAVRTYVAKASGSGESQAASAMATLPPTRASLLRGLERLGERFPELRFAQLIVRLAGLAKTQVPDASDAQLVEAARSGDLAHPSDPELQ